MAWASVQWKYFPSLRAPFEKTFPHGVKDSMRKYHILYWAHHTYWYYRSKLWTLCSLGIFDLSLSQIPSLPIFHHNTTQSSPRVQPPALHYHESINHPQIHVLDLNPKSDNNWRWTLWEVIRLWEWSPHDGVRGLVLSANRSGSSPYTWSWTFVSPELRERNVCFLSLLVYGIFILAAQTDIYSLSEGSKR
jgi:hypothetical protein